jgi:hypothetical protein
LYGKPSHVLLRSDLEDPARWRNSASVSAVIPRVGAQAAEAVSGIMGQQTRQEHGEDETSHLYLFPFARQMLGSARGLPRANSFLEAYFATALTRGRPEFHASVSDYAA